MLPTRAWLVSDPRPITDATADPINGLDRRQAAVTGESGSGYVRMVGGLDGTRYQLDGFSIPEPAPISPGPPSGGR